MVMGEGGGLGREEMCDDDDDDEGWGLVCVSNKMQTWLSEDLQMQFDD